jgi:hypothetical protein
VRAKPGVVQEADSGGGGGARSSPGQGRPRVGDDGWAPSVSLRGRATTGKRAGGLAGPAGGPMRAGLPRGTELLRPATAGLRGWRCWAATRARASCGCWAAGLDGVV